MVFTSEAGRRFTRQNRVSYIHIYIAVDAVFVWASETVLSTQRHRAHLVSVDKLYWHSITQHSNGPSIVPVCASQQ